LKRLIQDALPAMLAFDEQAQRKFEESQLQGSARQKRLTRKLSPVT
jgi:hypothetical protein